MADVEQVQLGMRTNQSSGLVEYGAIVNGVFHAFAAERTGDYQEAQAAGTQAQTEQPQTTGEGQ
jgi:hypothetical protein